MALPFWKAISRDSSSLPLFPCRGISDLYLLVVVVLDLVLPLHGTVVHRRRHRPVRDHASPAAAAAAAAPSRSHHSVPVVVPDAAVQAGDDGG